MGQSRLVDKDYNTAHEDNLSATQTHRQADSGQYDLLEKPLNDQATLLAVQQRTVSGKEYDHLLEQFEKLDEEYDALRIKHFRVNGEYYNLLEKYESLTAYANDLFALQLMEKWNKVVFGTELVETEDKEEKEDEEETDQDDKEDEEETDQDEEEDEEEEEEEEDSGDEENEDIYFDCGS